MVKKPKRAPAPPGARPSAARMELAVVMRGPLLAILLFGCIHGPPGEERTALTPSAPSASDPQPRQDAPVVAEMATAKQRQEAGQRARDEEERRLEQTRREADRAFREGLAAEGKRREDSLAAPKTRHIAWSAFACASQRKREQAKAAIAEEQRYADEGGGIVDMRAIYLNQIAMRFADRTLRRCRDELRALRLSQLGCRASRSWRRWLPATIPPPNRPAITTRRRPTLK